MATNTPKHNLKKPEGSDAVRLADFNENWDKLDAHNHALPELNGILPVSKGGSGAATEAEARAKLGANNAANLTTGTLPLDRLPVLPLAKGGFGATTPEAARAAIGAPIIDAWAAQCPAHIALEHALTLCKQHPYKVFGVETVQAQYDLYRQLREKAATSGIYLTKFKPIQPRTKKENRIEMLEPLIENGILRFRRQQRLLIEQLEQYPSGEHDDLPDALSGATDLCRGAVRRCYHKKPDGV